MRSSVFQYKRLKLTRRSSLYFLFITGSGRLFIGQCEIDMSHAFAYA